MTPRDTGRPQADECLPYYQQYIQLVPDGDIFETLDRQIGESAAYLATCTPEQARWREAPGEWNAVQIIGHLADTERVFGYRALRIARADPVMWTGVEFDDYVQAAHLDQRELADVLAEFATVRTAFAAFLRGLDADAWARRAPEDWTSRSVRAIAYAMAGHELHHLADLRRQRALQAATA